MNAKPTTDDLIRDLAARPLPATWSPATTFGAMLGAAALILALFFLIFGWRADLGAAMQQGPVRAKTLLPVTLFLVAAGLALASARPGRQVSLWPLAVPLGLGAVLVGLRIADGTGATLMAELVGKTAPACLVSITTMAMLPLGAGLFLARRAAPTRPALTGALLGLAAGAGIASGYALHCTEDSPLFFMTWYSLAICAVTLAGAVLGARLLRW